MRVFAQALLAEAEAVWQQYQQNDPAQCRALLASGQARAAHSLLVGSVAPALLLGGQLDELRELLVRAGELCGAPAVGAGSGGPLIVPEWETGGAMYLAYLELFCSPSGRSREGDGGADEGSRVLALLQQLQAASGKAQGGGGGGSEASSDSAGGQQRLRQRLVYSHMAQRLHQRVMRSAGRAAAAAAGSAEARAAMQAVLGLGCLPAELRISGVAAAVAASSSVLV